MSITAPNIGVVVTTAEATPTNNVPTNTATAFIVGRADQGTATTFQRLTSITQFVNVYGPRSSRNSVLYDSLDVMFRLGVPQAYVGRVVGPTPVNATLTLQDAGGHATLVATCDWPGVNGNAYYIVVTVNGGNFTIKYQDVAGNVLATSPPLADQASAIAWSQTAPFITLTAATVSGATTNNPTTLTSTALAGGTDDYTNATLTNWQTAVNLFPFTLGPGQVLAPGQTNTNLNGIWATLLFHAYTFNRFACMDMDATSAAALEAATIPFQTAYYGSYGMFDQPTAEIPGVSPGTTRTVPASAVRAGLVARVDASGNPNQAAAGRNWAVPYVINFNWYGGAQPTDADVLLMNQAGVNSFLLRYSVLESFGFSTPVPQTGSTTDPDAIYWQASHSRLRMAVVADSYAVGEPFVFAQIDGKGVEINAFATALASMLNEYYTIGALFGATAADAYRVDVGPTVNTINTITAGELKAAVYLRMSPFAQMVEIDISAVPTTQALP